MQKVTLPSVQSLFIEMLFDGQKLSTGTAFVVKSNQNEHLLITNRHNVTGRHQETNKPLSHTGGVPNQILIFHNKASSLGQWVQRIEPLYDMSGTPLWFEHPTLKSQADFVALRLTETTDVDFYPYDISNSIDVHVGPSDAISVIGFPFSIMVGGYLGIWATGFMASEPEVDFKNLPLFLIDCRTRPGQSGSPVIAYRSGGMFAMTNGSTALFGGPVQKFLGIYSGRINTESDLGMVWKRDAIKELVDSIGPIYGPIFYNTVIR